MMQNSNEQPGASAVRASQNESMEEAIMFAKKYLEDLLSFFGLNTDVYATTEDDEVIELDIPSTHLNGFLIGQHGDTMRALQYTISNALKNKNFSHTRVNVDVADYKKNRAERVVKNVEEWFRHVRDSGQAKELPPMNAADRRVVHKAAVDYGLNSESSGFGRDRHIVLKPAEGPEEKTDKKPAQEEKEAKSMEKPEEMPAKAEKKPKTKTKKATKKEK
ncbi:MAG TPA: R3H domain-containing nucleic acid-binding protein [Candidatus Saccharimonadales bacterium]|nr:R3H domain-containing nucleic acid-binding protein [Candidatus Saccharimonadales bacterium]